MPTNLGALAVSTPLLHPHWKEIVNTIIAKHNLKNMQNYFNEIVGGYVVVSSVISQHLVKCWIFCCSSMAQVCDLFFSFMLSAGTYLERALCYIWGNLHEGLDPMKDQGLFLWWSRVGVNTGSAPLKNRTGNKNRVKESSRSIISKYLTCKIPPVSHFPSRQPTPAKVQNQPGQNAPVPWSPKSAVKKSWDSLLIRCDATDPEDGAWRGQHYLSTYFFPLTRSHASTVGV